MTDYEFVTVWRLAAPIQQVWDAIVDVEAWPSWWDEVESVDVLETGDENGVGTLRHYVWQTKLPYQLAFDLRTTRVEPPHILEGAAAGELVGTGRWELSTDGENTVVQYTWRVRTNKAWMNLLAPVARPLFEWNHDLVMKQGGQALARLLDARLISDDVNYTEELSSNTTTALFVILTILFLLLFVRRVRSGKRGRLAALFAFLCGLFLFYVVNYRTLKIRLTAGALQLRFGIFTWTIPLDNIDKCELDDLPLLMRLGGAGIHFMSIRQRYRASFNFLEYPRVVVALKDRVGPVRDISFSTRRPDEVIHRIQEAVRKVDR